MNVARENLSLSLPPRAGPAPLAGVTPQWVRSQLIGRDATTRTPFGERRTRA